MSSSTRHQAHCVVNRNRKARTAAGVNPPITVCRGVPQPDPTDGRLKVVPVRDFDFQVKVMLREGKFSYEDAPNPLNQLGAIVEGHVPVVTSNDYQSFLAAFNKRSNFTAKDDISDDVYKHALQLVENLPDLFPLWDDNDADRERWLSKFPAEKRKRMESGWAEVPYATFDYIGTKDLSVKQEVLYKRYDPEWAPRLIYAGNDCFNAVTGPASMIVMERLCQLLKVSKVGSVEFMPAYKTDDVTLCAFLKSAFKECVEGDFSRNDREQRRRVALIYDAWLRKLGLPNWFRHLLLEIDRFAVQNKRFGLKAWLKYQLPTGTTSTTPRNTTYNITMFALTCLRQNRRGRAVVLGDDLLAVLNKRLDLDAWVATVAQFRMVLKAKSPVLDGEATFLSRRMIFASSVPCMVPLLGKMLVRFNVRGTMGECSDSAYMAGKALSYAYECRHVPLLRDIFLKRYEMEDSANVHLSDLTWFARSSGVRSVEDVLRRVKEEPVHVTLDEFGFWLLDVYDLDFCEVRDMFEQIVLNPHLVATDLPNMQFMHKDL